MQHHEKGFETMSTEETLRPRDFIRTAVEEDLTSCRFDRVHTRFPPEPNGYLHIGQTQYVEQVMEDIRWLGYDWEDRLFFASDYFEQLYEYGVQLIKKGKAYVCDLSADEVREYRGTLTEPGRDSPYRDRPLAENLDLFARMRAGEFPDGARTLRAMIDMASPNFNLRDPIMYRILHAEHHRTGDDWCIYPMYDFAHGQSDSIEGITHSLCSLEYEDHRPLYNWFLDELEIYHPRQIEFARFALTYTVMSKRRLLRLVNEGLVSGWDDPRMPTLAGLRRRGYTPEAIRDLVDRAGVAKTNSIVDIALQEHCLRQDLNKRSPRRFGVLRPLKVVLLNYPEGQVEEMECINNPEDPAAGTRMVPFSRELYVERTDYREDAPRKWYRLAPGREVRLRYAYFVTCVEAIKDEQGQVVELHCTYDPETRGGSAPDGRKVRGTIHWVPADHAVEADVRLYDRLFSVPNPLDVEEGEDWVESLNPDSLELLTGCRLEPSMVDAAPGSTYQFERNGYFCVDSQDSAPGSLVFNRTVSLRDSWAKIEKAQKQRRK